MGRILIQALVVAFGAGGGLLGPIHAQNISASVSGWVVDPHGNPIPGAQVVVVHRETQAERVTRSDARGAFVLGGLALGSYDLRVSCPGYATGTHGPMVVRLGESAPLTLPLTPDSSLEELGNLFDQGVVNALKIDSSRLETATAFSPKALQGLPLKGRSFLDFAQLAPLVQLSDTPGHSPMMAIAGQRGINSSITVDGAEFNDPFFHGYLGSTTARNPYTLSLEAVREFQVVTEGGSAAWGRMGGGYLNAVTRSGGNEPSGSLFWFHRPQSLVAREPGSATVSSFDTQQFGGSWGGPLVRNRLFLFVAVDAQREQRPQPFAWGAPLDPLRPADAVLLARGGDYASRADSDTVFVRLDWHPNAHHHLYARLNRSLYQGEFNTGRTITAEATGRDRIRTWSGVTEWTWLGETGWFNLLRVNMAQGEMPRSPNTMDPQVVVGGVGTIGKYPFTRDFVSKRLQITEEVSRQGTEWSGKLGVDFNLTRFDQIFMPYREGSYFFDSLESWRSGKWSTFTQAFGLTRPGLADGRYAAWERELALYGEAVWVPTRTVKCSLGLRWDRQVHPSDGIPDPTRLLDSPVPLTGHVPTDAQWSPRFAFTWRPTALKGNGVLRGSVGLFVSRTPQVDTIAAFLQNGRRVGQFTFSGSGEPVLPWGPAFRHDHPQILQSLPTGAQVGRPNLFTFSPGFRNPRTTRWALGYDHLFREWLLGCSLAYSRTSQLERRNDLNLGPPTLSPEGRWIFGTRPNPSIGRFLAYTSDADASFRSMTWSMQYRGDQLPLEFQAFYTLAYARDTNSNERLFLDDATQNVQKLEDERSWGDLDRRHQLTMLGIYKSAATGIELGATFRFLSARPYSVVHAADLNRDGLAGNDRLLGSIRNGFRSAPQASLDVRISREWRLGRTVVSPSLEVFNLLNRASRFNQLKFSGTDAASVLTQVPTPLATVDSTLFPTRQVQVGLRLAY